MIMCRFRVTSVTHFEHNQSVKLQAIYSPDGTESPEVQEEIRQFHESTPNGILEFTVTGRQVGSFRAGQDYYLKLEKVPAR